MRSGCARTLRIVNLATQKYTVTSVQQTPNAAETSQSRPSGHRIRPFRLGRRVGPTKTHVTSGQGRVWTRFLVWTDGKGEHSGDDDRLGPHERVTEGRLTREAARRVHTRGISHIKSARNVANYFHQQCYNSLVCQPVGFSHERRLVKSKFRANEEQRDARSPTNTVKAIHHTPLPAPSTLHDPKIGI